MWNLKNTSKLTEFKEIKSISFDTYMSKLYSIITLENEEKFIFDLSKIYQPIPSTFNDKEIELDPEDHQIQVLVNTLGNNIKPIIDDKQKNASLERVEYSKEKIARDKKDDLTPEKVSTIIDTEKNREIKNEIVKTYEDDLLKKLEKKGIVDTEGEI